MEKRIVILGAGESGTGAAVLAKTKGFEVFVSDLGKIKPHYKEILFNYEIEWEEEQHTEKYILNADEVIKSPGITDKSDMVQLLMKKNIPIISEIEFAGRYTEAKKICITGSNGKTTTTSLLHHMLRRAGLNCGLAGNVGKSFAMQVATKTYDYYVIELSSFQLDGMYKFKPDISILLNITPDHLDRYNYNIQNYVDSKMKITQNLSEDDYFIYCSDDEITIAELERIVLRAKQLEFSQEKIVDKGAYVDNGNMVVKVNNDEMSMPLSEMSLKGKHNTYNSMAASIASRVLEIKKEVIRECLQDFKGVEHRLERFIKVHGIEFINDSKATNVNSTWYALECMTTPTVWIVGGVDKGNDYSSLVPLVKDKVKAIVCLGVDNSKIHEAFKDCVDKIIDTSSMKEAVTKAYKLGEKEDTVLLSPACASFDLFKSYEDRGEQFKECVREL
ncbi:MAG: UDP-N-acetylmuramoyl-L-alanine--D-glutamate ligase [Bacteroidales bacterium]|nr:UDP-N-acetylmuramoyl-L-alanine--D-glutamate ligase [Bacteroidales bacterium]MBN2817972.1 UDP-N-acetylmuramoyl-L-alanine--D-glutamate ligase [Bacteroidales bacterium]